MCRFDPSKYYGGASLLLQEPEAFDISHVSGSLFVELDLHPRADFDLRIVIGQEVVLDQ